MPFLLFSVLPQAFFPHTSQPVPSFSSTNLCYPSSIFQIVLGQVEDLWLVHQSSCDNVQALDDQRRINMLCCQLPTLFESDLGIESFFQRLLANQGKLLTGHNLGVASSSSLQGEFGSE